MNTSLKVPNCCYICLKEPSSLSQLTKKILKFKEFVSYEGSSVQGVTTYSIDTFTLPICYSCKKKSGLSKLLFILSAVLLPVISIPLVYLIFYFFETLIFSLFKFSIPFLSSFILLASLVISIIYSIKLFRLRNSYGLDKTSLLAKSIKFKNIQYQNAFELINKG